MQRAVRTVLPPGYDARRPANSRPGLGDAVVGRVRSVNDCYGGVVADADPTWQSIEVVYHDHAAAKVEADLGEAVDLSASGRVTVDGEVTLRESAVFELSELVMDPVSGCATSEELRKLYKRKGGKKDRVVIRSVRARELSSALSRSAGGNVDVSVPVSAGQLGGEIEASDDVRTALTGQGLFYAEEVARVRTRLRDLPPAVIAPGQGTGKLTACRVVLASVGDVDGQRRWTGDLSCDDGVARPLNGRIGGIVLARTGKGVSYSVSVEDTNEPGKFRVAYARWVVER
jgi:hypothetical protein